MWVTETRFSRNESLAKKKSEFGKQSARVHGGSKPSQSVVCTDNQILQ